MASDIVDTEYFDRTLYLTPLQYAVKYGCTKEQMARWLGSYNAETMQFALPNPMRTWRDKEPVQETPQDVGPDDCRHGERTHSMSEV